MSHRLTSGQRVNGASDPWMRRGRGNHLGRRENDGRKNKGTKYGSPRKAGGERESQGYDPPALANPGNIVDCGAAGGGRIGSELAHQNEAPFPEKLAEFFVRSFAPPGGLVLDPFSGSGTTGALAVRLRRRFLGADIRASQVALSRKRISQETPLLCGYGEEQGG
jgi:DNA modification methylase